MKSVQEITAELLACDGTVPVSNVAAPQQGYVVGINGQGIVSTDPAEAYRWVASQRSRAALPGHHLGSWLDTETGKRYLDLVRVFSERATAEEFGRDQEEIAIYDLKKGEEIRL